MKKQGTQKLGVTEKKIVQAVGKNPGSTGWKIRELIGGEIAVSNHIPSLIRRGFLRKENVAGSCRYYPV